jgi:hypothetical protein
MYVCTRGCADLVNQMAAMCSQQHTPDDNVHIGAATYGS